MDFLSGIGNFLEPLMSMFGGGGGGGSSPTSGAFKGASGSSQMPGGEGFLNSLFPSGTAQGLTGLGTLGLGQAFSPKLKAPDFNGLQSVQNLQNWGNSASHPLDPNIAKSIQDSANIQNEQQLRSLRDTYKNARPGTDYTTDSAYQRDLANLNRSMSQNTSDAMANATLSSNSQQLGNMTNLANLDVGKAEQEYSQQAAQKQNLNQMFGNVGSMFLQKGIGMPNMGNLASLFGGK